MAHPDMAHPQPAGDLAEPAAGPARQDPVLAVRSLSVSYHTGSGPVRVVHDLDLDLSAGETLALVGESGSGKTTTAHAIAGLLPSMARIDGGSVTFGRRDLVTLPERQLRALRGRYIGVVPQDPGVALNPVRRVGPQVAEVLRIHRLAPRHDLPRLAVELLDQAGVPDPARRARQYPHELSGGLRQRVLIAIALAAQPRLLIADEPTSALDVTVQRRILDHLGRLADAAGIAILLVTHDLAVAAERADRIAVMTGGRVVETGPARDLLADPSHPYTRRLVEDAPSLAPARARPARTSPGPGPAPLLAVEHLTRHFPGEAHPAVDDVTFTIGPRETLALVGESGSGKTTTARLVTRLLAPSGGRIRLRGQDVTTARGGELRALRRHVQLVYQNPYASLDPRHTIAQVIIEPLRAYRVGTRPTRRARAAELLDRVGLPAATLDRRAAELSGGQRQRVAIARALALEPELIVFDEPVSALDVSVQAQILDLLARVQDETGVAYLFISHDLAVVSQLAHRVAVMRAGRVVETGPTGEVFTRPSHPCTQELLDAIPGARRTPRQQPPAHLEEAR
ncbi:dipeptide ABC transporter ATP-binding protein [Frankia nepalensis]|nr:ABC transporter ATP-binding protein [Frankia nepalensis]